jgi:hypothetical protein
MAEGLTNDVLHLRLPLKPEYLNVLRTTAAVISGTLDFNYDEIIQVRVAVAELFDLAAKNLPRGRRPSEADDLQVRFIPRASGLEIVVKHPTAFLNGLGGEENRETQALLDSLMDVVELGADDSVVRIVKYRSSQEAL